jgi:WD40 repeat protein
MSCSRLLKGILIQFGVLPFTKWSNTDIWLSYQPLGSYHRRTTADLKGHIYAVHSISFLSNGQVPASSRYDYTIKLWDPATWELLQTFESFYLSLVKIQKWCIHTRPVDMHSR